MFAQLSDLPLWCIVVGLPVPWEAAARKAA